MPLPESQAKISVSPTVVRHNRSAVDLDPGAVFILIDNDGPLGSRGDRDIS